jgi:hypothetical protein
MTCEIAVMNKRGLALAADSAVTIGEGEKIYHHAEKLFALPSGAPVGILIYGSAEIMGAPWELVIHGYARELGQRRFDRIDQYAEEFFRFAEASTALFPPDLQRDWFRYLVGDYWHSELSTPLAHRLKVEAKDSPHAANACLLELLGKDHASWEPCAPMEELGAAFCDRIIADYEPVLDALERKLFGAHRLNADAKRGLRATVRFMLARQWIHPAERCGIVFAGMGEAEPFPVLQDFAVGSIVGGRLRRFVTNEARITREDSAIVAPFAQSDMVATFYRGIVPDLDEKLGDIVARSVTHELAKHGETLPEERLEKLRKTFRKTLDEEIDGRFQRPLIAAVDALPRRDLARIAEALVSLTALRRRMSLGEKETVGGAIDVAILSKAEGFQWVKRGGCAVARM